MKYRSNFGYVLSLFDYFLDAAELLTPYVGDRCQLSTNLNQAVYLCLLNGLSDSEICL